MTSKVPRGVRGGLSLSCIRVDTVYHLLNSLSEGRVMAVLRKT